MDWLRNLTFPIHIKLAAKYSHIVRFNKIDTYKLEECEPQIIRRERTFQMDRLDQFHKRWDGTIDHKVIT